MSGLSRQKTTFLLATLLRATWDIPSLMLSGADDARMSPDLTSLKGIFTLHSLLLYGSLPPCRAF